MRSRPVSSMESAPAHIAAARPGRSSRSASRTGGEQPADSGRGREELGLVDRTSYGPGNRNGPAVGDRALLSKLSQEICRPIISTYFLNDGFSDTLGWCEIIKSTHFWQVSVAKVMKFARVIRARSVVWNPSLRAM